MMSKQEIREWLDTLPDDAQIRVDGIELGLQVNGSEAYLAIGGLPDDWEDAHEEEDAEDKRIS
jgi:hypothetical protein